MNMTEKIFAGVLFFFIVLFVVLLCRIWANVGAAEAFEAFLSAISLIVVAFCFGVLVGRCF